MALSEVLVFLPTFAYFCFGATFIAPV